MSLDVLTRLSVYVSLTHQAISALNLQYNTGLKIMKARVAQIERERERWRKRKTEIKNILKTT